LRASRSSRSSLAVIGRSRMLAVIGGDCPWIAFPLQISLWRLRIFSTCNLSFSRSSLNRTKILSVIDLAGCDCSWDPRTAFKILASATVISEINSDSCFSMRVSKEDWILPICETSFVVEYFPCGSAEDLCGDILPRVFRPTLV